MNQTKKRPTNFQPDFDKAPFIVLWELTRACGLKCQHCRAVAIQERDPDELSTEEARKFLKNLREIGKPLIVLTGGDPVQRPDLFDIVKACKEEGFTVAMTPSGTPSVTESIVKQLKEAGLERLAISLDGPTREVHDEFRGVSGSFDWSMDIISWAHKYELPIQINTVVSKHSLDYFDEMAKKVEELKAVLWSVFFLVPVGRASEEMQVSPGEAEQVMIKMSKLAESGPFDVKGTAAPQFRRVVLQRQEKEKKKDSKVLKNEARQPSLANLKESLKLGKLRSYGAVNDGRGMVFISHTGDIMPSGFLPISAGNVKDDSIVDVYRNHKLFKELRDPDLLTGKCGQCSYREPCGGSRARAYGKYGDYLAEDPLCAFHDMG